MGIPLKFEFDFDEVFEGIKQGVIRELSETNFDEAKDIAINQIKSEIKDKVALLYQDIFSSKEEIKTETKDKVFDTLLKEVHSKYCNQFEEYIEEQLAENPNRLEELRKEVKEELVERLYDDLYSSIKAETIERLKETTAQLFNLVDNNRVKVRGSNKTISEKEYEELLDRDKKLSALEFGGVDNWEWYSESLSRYYDEED